LALASYTIASRRDFWSSYRSGNHIPVTVCKLSFYRAGILRIYLLGKWTSRMLNAHKREQYQKSQNTQNQMVNMDTLATRYHWGLYIGRGCTWDRFFCWNG
jgi:hypothetical protein